MAKNVFNTVVCLTGLDVMFALTLWGFKQAWANLECVMPAVVADKQIELMVAVLWQHNNHCRSIDSTHGTYQVDC